MNLLWYSYSTVLLFLFPTRPSLISCSVFHIIALHEITLQSRKLQIWKACSPLHLNLMPTSPNGMVRTNLIVVLSRRDDHESAGVSSFYCHVLIIPNPPFSHSLLCLSYHCSPQNHFAVKQVTHMNSMFAGAQVFNADLSKWDGTY
jgi:hypothetical protein